MSVRLNPVDGENEPVEAGEGDADREVGDADGAADSGNVNTENDQDEEIDPEEWELFGWGDGQEDQLQEEADSQGEDAIEGENGERRRERRGKHRI